MKNNYLTHIINLQNSKKKKKTPFLLKRHKNKEFFLKLESFIPILGRLHIPKTKRDKILKIRFDST